MNFLYMGERSLSCSGRFFMQENNIYHLQVTRRNIPLHEFLHLRGTSTFVVAISATQEPDNNAIAIAMILVDTNIEDQEVLVRGNQSRNGLGSRPLLPL